MKGKPPSINPLSILANGSTNVWNAWLTHCLRTHNITDLTTVLYGLQQGMAELARQKLNTEKVSVFFIRLCRSIENTIHQIVREKDPMRLDSWQEKKRASKKDHSAKQNRDHDLRRFIRKESF